MMSWASDFHNGISHINHMTSLYWSKALECVANLLWPSKALYIWTVHCRQCQVTSCHITDQPGYCQGPLATLENTWLHHCYQYSTSEESGTVLGLHPANERRRYKVTLSLIGRRKPIINPALDYILLWFDTGWFKPYPSGLMHWHWGNHRIAPVPGKQTLKI